MGAAEVVPIGRGRSRARNRDPRGNIRGQTPESRARTSGLPVTGTADTPTAVFNVPVRVLSRARMESESSEVVLVATVVGTESAARTKVGAVPVHPELAVSLELRADQRVSDRTVARGSVRDRPRRGQPSNHSVAYALSQRPWLAPPPSQGQDDSDSPTRAIAVSCGPRRSLPQAISLGTRALSTARSAAAGGTRCCPIAQPKYGAR